MGDAAYIPGGFQITPPFKAKAFNSSYSRCPTVHPCPGTAPAVASPPYTVSRQSRDDTAAHSHSCAATAVASPPYTLSAIT
uniref:Uncharacterized protein n=1 Tax=Rhipicephalus zambeziensis TaxID=60191 RepID=A0A224Y730_9ACAR